MPPFVSDPNVFANITTRSFETTVFGRFYIINQYVASVFGICSISLALFTIIHKTPKTMMSFRKILLITTSIDLYLWFVYSLVQVRVRYIGNVGLYSYLGAVSLMPSKIQVILSSMYSAGTILTCLVLPLPFIYRHFLLKNGTPSNRLLFGCLAVIFGFLSVDVIGSVLENKVADTSIDYGHLWYVEKPIPPLIVYDYTRNLYAAALKKYRQFELLGSFLITFFVAWRSYRLLKNQQATLSTPRSRAMDQFTRLLFAQLLIPIATLFLPLLVTLFFSSMSISDEIQQQTMFIFFSYAPFSSSTATIVLIVPYRRAIVQLLKRLICFQSKPSVNPIFVTHSYHYT